MTPEQRLDFQVNFELNDFTSCLKEFLAVGLDCETRLSLEHLDRFICEVKRTITQHLGEDLMAKAGYVYLIRTYDSFYKIGESKDLRKRLLGLTGPIEEVIHKIQTDDCKRLEKYLHDMHASERRGQEIFKLSQEDVANLCRVNHVWYEGQGIHNQSLF